MTHRKVGVRRRPRPAWAFTGWLLLLFSALALVVWRQTRGVALERELRGVGSERQIAEAERVELVRRIQALHSRARIAEVAGEQLNMRVPEDHEIVFLPLPRERGAGAGIQLAGDQ